MSRRRPKSNNTEYRMVRAIDELAEFERFQEEIMPILKTAIKERWSADKIWNHPTTQALLAARAVTIGVMDKDPARALSAIKDLMDRSVGKPTEKREVKHQLEKLSEDQLDSLLLSQLQDLEQEDEDGLPN